jgi:hypothetical protein
VVEVRDCKIGYFHHVTHVLGRRLGAGLHASKSIKLNILYFWQQHYVYMYMLCIYTKIL